MIKTLVSEAKKGNDDERDKTMHSMVRLKIKWNILHLNRYQLYPDENESLFFLYNTKGNFTTATATSLLPSQR